MTTEIQSVIQAYFQGYLSADSEQIARAFHPQARLYATEDTKLEKTELAEWLDSLRQRRAKGDIRQGKLEIASMDVAGTAAAVKTILTFPTFEFTDYLSLLQIEGQWRIIGKIYAVRST
ncbi:MAG: nuclear transport factor 2 family protein [Deltaproteobacteria bacterium]|nr:nuclear transport factor 2 family protein [Deltaproteobacteria bacterium]